MTTRIFKGKVSISLFRRIPSCNELLLCKKANASLKHMLTALKQTPLHLFLINTPPPPYLTL